MKTNQSKSIARLLLLSCLAGALATTTVVPAAEPRQDINPALLYWQAFSVFPELNDTDKAALYAISPTAAVSPAETAAARAFDPTFKLIRRAVRMRVPCDWGLDLADGPEMVVPNIAKIRLCQDAAQLRARVALAEGRDDDAVADITSTLIMARRMARQGALVQSMIQISVEENLIEFIAGHFSDWSPQGLQSVLATLRDTTSRATTRDALVVERQAFLEWIVSKLTTIVGTAPGNDEESLTKCLAFFRSIGFSEEETQALLVDQAQGSGQRLIEAMRRLSDLYDLMQAVASAAPAEWEPRRSALEHYLNANPVARLFAPNIAGARAVELRWLSRIPMLEAAIAYRVDGLAGLKTVQDPFGDGPFDFRRAVGENGRPGFELESDLALPDIKTAVFFAASPASP